MCSRGRWLSGKIPVGPARCLCTCRNSAVSCSILFFLRKRHSNPVRTGRRAAEVFFETFNVPALFHHLHAGRAQPVSAPSALALASLAS